MEKKAMQVLQATSLRSIVEQTNSLGIQKEDVVTLMNVEGNIFLVYYK